MSFEGFPKISRLNREMIVTEKIDGTNAQVHVVEKATTEWAGYCAPDQVVWDNESVAIFAGSRNRYLTLENDNFGFARWVHEHAAELLELGPGRHYGEWWGQGIQRGYGLEEKRFSLFNVHRWGEERPACCHVVPVLYQWLFDTCNINRALHRLAEEGSQASPGFMRPEGVVVYHTHARQLFKVTIEKDDVPKGGQK